MSVDTNITYAPFGLNVPAKATATAGTASAAVQFRTPPAANTSLVPTYVIVKASSSAAGPGFHVAFGDSTIGAPTAADMCLQDTDGWIRLLVPTLATNFRIFAEGTTAGSVYVLVVKP